MKKRKERMIIELIKWKLKDYKNNKWIMKIIIMKNK